MNHWIRIRLKKLKNIK